MTALAEELRTIARAHGIDAVGFTSAAVLEPARTVLPLRKEAGLASSMQFTYRNPERSTDPNRSMEGARSIVAAASGYRRQIPDRPAEASARVARYAWRDHYQDLRAGLDVMAVALRDAGWKARVHLDDNHLVDRNVAFRAGLGWYGKNANLLLPELGSWFVLGNIVTDADLDEHAPPVADGCGPCRACIDDCPTGAIVAPGVIDARRCLAWLVQGPGEIPVEFRRAVGDRIYGCDDCQDVCPPNRGVDRREEAPEAEADSDAWVEIAWLLQATDEELGARIGRWYIAGRDFDVVRRTALVVLGNIGDPANAETWRLLDRYLDHERPLLAEHAEWAAAELRGRH